jgi:hypothetical protein
VVHSSGKSLSHVAYARSCTPGEAVSSNVLPSGAFTYTNMTGLFPHGALCPLAPLQVVPWTLSPSARSCAPEHRSPCEASVVPPSDAGHVPPRGTHIFELSQHVVWEEHGHG